MAKISSISLRKRHIAIFCVALVVIILSLLCVPQRVYQAFYGVELEMGEHPEIAKTVQINIDGWIVNRVFGERSFRGRFEIDAYPVTMTSDVRAFLSNDFSGGVLTYIDAEREPSFGVLYSNCSFGLIAVNLLDITKVVESELQYESSGVVGRRLIIAPAKTVDDAQDVLDRLNIHWMEDYTGILRFPQ